MSEPSPQRIADAENHIDVSSDAYQELLRLMKEQPGRKARIQIAGYG